MASREQTVPRTPLSSIVYSAGTDVGMRREENQDSYGIMLGEQYKLFIVADGMGGVQGGAIASNLAITTIEKQLRNKSSCSKSQLTDAIQAANAAIHDRGKNDSALTGMGTTIVCLLCGDKQTYIANVGDSRLYRIRASQAARMTEDHTLVHELVRSGAITEEQAEHHPVSHMLTRSLGPSPRIEVDCFSVRDPLQKGDRFLLCSDGLYNMVKEQEIGEIVSGNSTDDAVQMLIDLANERGGSDNITVVIIDVGAEYPDSVSVEKDDDREEEEFLADDHVIEESAEPPRSSGASMIGGYHDTREVIELKEEVPDAESVGEPEQEAVDAPFESELEPEQEAFVEEAGEIDEIDEIDELEHTEAEVPEVIEEEDEFVPAPISASPGVSSQGSRLPLLAGGFFGGIIVAFIALKATSGVSIFNIGGDEGPQEPVIAQTEASFSDDEAKESKSLLPILSTVYSTPAAAAVHPPEIDEVLGTSSQPRITSKIGPAERSSIVKRKNDLRSIISSAGEKLAKLEKPMTGELGDMLKESTKRAEEVQAKIDQIKADTDLATRKLAVWYDRKRRLENTDAINLAGEVAVTVPSVKQKKEDFERATWDYLKEVEALRYSPGDSSKETHVAELVKIRAAKMRELSEEVRGSIEKALSEADHGIADLTLQRSQLETTLEGIRRDLDFVRTVTNGDPAKQQQLRSDLIKRKESAQTELEELEKLLPQAEEG